MTKRTLAVSIRLAALLAMTGCFFAFGVLSLNAATPPPNRAQSTSIQFADSGQALGGNANSTDVALGDLDGDGDPDAFVTNIWDGSSSRSNKIWINQGGAQAGTPGVFADSGQNLGVESGTAVALGHLDGDSDLDAFVIYDDLPAKIWLNNGGTFSDSGQNLPVNQGAEVALGDLDGDTDLDAFVVSGVGRADTVWINQGGAQAGTPGNFADSGQTLGATSSTSVSLGDVDSDGDLDALVGTSAGAVLWFNQGGTQGGAAGVFAQGNTLGSAFNYEVVLANLNGDTTLDAFVANNTSPDHVWLNNGGAFTDSGQALGNGMSRGVALADIDGDTDLDAFVSVYGPNLVWVNQSGVFSASGPALGSASSEGAALGDLDGDGTLDAFVANWGAPNEVWFNQTAPAGPQADLSLRASGIEAVDASNTGSFVHSVVISNSGDTTATNVSLVVNSDRSGQLFTGPLSCLGAITDNNPFCSFSLLGSGASQPVSVFYSVGGAVVDPFSTYQFLLASQFSVSSDTADPNPANNSATAATHVFNCNITNCVVESLFCAISFGGFPFSASTDTVTKLASTAVMAFDLPLLYRVRDEILAGSPEGQHFTNLYYTHNVEITSLVLSNTTVMTQALHTLQIWEPNLRALVQGQGDSVIISAAQIQAMDDFLALLSTLGSPALQQAIAAERARLPALSSFVGLTMTQARSDVVGFGVYLPVIIK